MTSAIEKKARPFSCYVGETLRAMQKKYGISESDLERLQGILDETAEDWFLRDALDDAVKTAQIKQEVKKPLDKKDLAGILATCQRLVRGMMRLKLGWSDELLKSVSKRVAGQGMFSKGDAAMPFYSECFLYNLLGKDDARTVLYRMEELARVLGVEE